MLNVLNVFVAPLFSLLLAAGTEVTLGSVKSSIPKSWKEIPTTSSMRYKQFAVPRAAGDTVDTELVVFYFQGQGGGAQENIARWKKMFQAPTGKTIDEVSTVETVKVGVGKATILDVKGTYLYKPMPMAPQSEPRANHRMLSVVLDVAGGPFFIRFVGPQKTINQHKKDFDTWLSGHK